MLSTSEAVAVTANGREPRHKWDMTDMIPPPSRDGQRPVICRVQQGCVRRGQRGGASAADLCQRFSGIQGTPANSVQKYAGVKLRKSGGRGANVRYSVQ